MAGIGEIIALAASGMLINDRIKVPTKIKKNKKAMREKTNATDIYNQQNLLKNEQYISGVAKKKIEDSYNFKNTGIYPNRYKEVGDYMERRKKKKIKSIETFADSDSEFSDDSNMTIQSNQSDESDIFKSPDHMINRMKRITDNTKYEYMIKKTPDNYKKDKFNENNTWHHQMDPMKFDNTDDIVSSNNTNKSGSIGSRIEIEREMEINGGYSIFETQDDGTYGVVRAESTDFTHQNMKPYYRKQPNQNNESSRADVNNRKLELFTGSINNPDWKPKTERAPLFSPLIGAQNIYGAPVQTDEQESRYFPGIERRNELPFQQVQITPGLDMGYNDVSTNGYQDPFRVLPKSVDELRTVNNPKISYGSYIGPGQKGEVGPVMGKLLQKKPDTYTEYGKSDIIKGGRAYLTAPTVYGNYDPKNLSSINRGTKKTIAIGPAQNQLEGDTPDRFRGNWQEARRENYLYDSPHNVAPQEQGQGQGHNNKQYIPDPTNRENKGVVSNMIDQNKGSYAVNMTNATNDPSMRTIHNNYQRVGTVTGFDRNNAVNMNDVMDPTMRDIHNKTTHNGIIQQSNMQHTTINWNNIMDPTMRDIHQQYDRLGNTVGNKNQMIAIDRNDVRDQNLRNIHGRYDRSGHVTGNKNQELAIDRNDIGDPTMRDVHQRYDRSGHVTGNKNQGVVIDLNDVGDPTMRDIHQRYDRAGHVTGNKNQRVAIDLNDVGDPTMRDVHQRYDRSGHVTGNKNQELAINLNDVGDPTMRDIHQRYDRSGHVTGNKNQELAINLNDVGDPTMRDVHQRYDRSGHVTGNKNQELAIDLNDVGDPTMRDVHQRYDRSGHVTGNKNRGMAVDLNDVGDPTMRDVHQRYDRSGHVTGNKNRGMAVDLNDVADPTMRDVHQRYDRSGHVTGNKNRGMAVDLNDVGDPTMRDVHQRYDRTGHVTGNKNQVTVIDLNDVADPTMRDVHQRYDRSGHVTGNRNQVTVIDLNDVADPTMRDVHQRYDRTGHVTGNKNQVMAVDLNDVADPTMRDVHHRYDRTGHVTGNKNQVIAVDLNDVGDPTMRTIHNEGRTGTLYNSTNGHKTVDLNDVPDPTMRAIHLTGRTGTLYNSTNGHRTVDLNDVPDPTMRSIHLNGRTCMVSVNTMNQGSRKHYMNMMINAGKESLNEGRSPTEVGVNKGWSINHTAFQLKKPLDQNNRWIPPKGTDLTYNDDRLEKKYKMSNRVVINNKIFGDKKDTRNNLQGNPYINNNVHRSITDHNK